MAHVPPGAWHIFVGLVIAIKASEGVRHSWRQVLLLEVFHFGHRFTPLLLDLFLDRMYTPQENLLDTCV